MKSYVSVGEAVRRYLDGQYRALTARETDLSENRDPECLHKFRVALRRSRALLGEMRDYLLEDLAALREDMAEVARATNPARDADVFLADLATYRTWLPAFLQPGLEGIRKDLEGRRLQAHEEVSALLAAPTYRKLKSDWEHWLVADSVDLAADSGFSEKGRKDRALESAIERKVERRIGKVLKRARKITAKSSPQEMHRLRIACKKLRYLLEFAQQETDDPRAKEAIGGLKKIQTLLGDYNDAAVQMHRLRDYLETQEKRSKHTAAVIGYLLRLLERRQEKLRRKFLKKSKRLDRLGEFWIK
ncbi:CHAD domain-containing protein [Methylohalobius crimeensis]|uniref:CHAD domain-containing protein n=1 Tax=Methylohalobius crimeensis TaxID=244365 RepID=UPI0003B3AA9F|nr:CHAD domain-containing protein [Methylohalobius crimeensis]